MFTFGDSYSTTGFNISSTKPDQENPFGNPTFPGVTSSGGYNWLGWLISDYNKKNTNTFVYNFAYPGATVDRSVIPPSSDNSLTLTDQIGRFTKHLAKKPDYAPWESSNTLAGIWIGINDVDITYQRQNASEYIKESVDVCFEQLEVLYDTGIRSFFVLQVPPLDKTPKIIAKSEKPTKKISEYNKRISEKLESFNSAHEDARTALIDTSAPFNKAIVNPKMYNATDATCQNTDGTSCLWCNDFHPGVAIHKLVAYDVNMALGKGNLW
ncbi:unnamed protein product [Clonostachys rosea f. rosea IK726]|nr:unnamed protein product [Clonostachys rosea f. rosea IK726]